MTRRTTQRSYKTEISRDNARALEAVANRLLAEKDDEIARLRAVLEIIAGSSDKLQALQARAALDNIGAAVSPAKRSPIENVDDGAS